MNKYKKNKDESVDFEAVPPEQLLKLLIIQTRDDILNEIQLFLTKTAKGQDPSIAKLKGMIYRFWIDLRPNIKEKFPKDNDQEFQDIKEIDNLLIDSDEFSDLKKIFDFISDYLYSRGVLKFETRMKYDRTNIELSNRLHGFY